MITFLILILIMYLDNYLIKPSKFVNWLDTKRVYYEYLLQNPNVGYFINEIDPKYYIWYDICKNPTLIPLISMNIDKLDSTAWNALCYNPNAMGIIKENKEKLSTNDWCVLCLNPNSIDIICENMNKLSNKHG